MRMGGIAQDPSAGADATHPGVRRTVARPAGSVRTRLIRGGSWALAGKTAAAFSGLAANVLLTRVLAPADLGAYYLAASLAFVGGIIGVFGLDQTVVRLIASGLHGSGRVVLRRAAMLVACFAAGAGLLIIAARPLWAEYLLGMPQLRGVAVLIGAWAAVVAFQRLTSEGFRGLHDIRAASFFDRAAPTLLLAAALLIPMAMRRTIGLATALGLALAAAVVSLWIAFAILRRRLPGEAGTPAVPAATALLAMSAPLMVSSAAFYALVHVDIWVVGAILRAEDVALYGAASKLVTVVAMPLMIVNAVLPPLIAELHAAGDRARLERVVRVSATAAGVPAALVLISFIVAGEAILGFAFGDFYRSSAVVLALLSIGQLVNVWAGSCGFVLIMTGKVTAMMRITAATGTITMVAAVALARPLGIAGVAAAMAFGLLLQNVLMVLAVRRLAGVWTHVTLKPEHLRGLRSLFSRTAR